jgi:hypothetical protein
MSASRTVALGLVVSILVTGLTIATPRKAQADDEWLWALGGLVVGSLLASDHGARYYAPPPRARIFYYPRHRLYMLIPVNTGPRWRARYWIPAGQSWRGRPVWAPATAPRTLEGPRKAVVFKRGHEPVLRLKGSSR